MDLLLNKSVVDSHSLHKVSHSFLKVVPSERASIATGIVIVDNTRLVIQVEGYTPRMVLLDTGAQLVILGVQFAKKMGMFDSKLRKCRNPTLGLSVRMQFTLPKVGKWSPLGLPKIQKTI
jgi:hypothetical protein